MCLHLCILHVPVMCLHAHLPYPMLACLYACMLLFAPPPSNFSWGAAFGPLVCGAFACVCSAFTEVYCTPHVISPSVRLGAALKVAQDFCNTLRVLQKFWKFSTPLGPNQLLQLACNRSWGAL